MTTPLPCWVCIVSPGRSSEGGLLPELSELWFWSPDAGVVLALDVAEVEAEESDAEP